jgi:hypothetical protein
MPLAFLASSYDLDKFRTPPDCALFCDESRTTFLHWRDIGTVSSPSGQQVVAIDSRDLLH